MNYSSKSNYLLKFPRQELSVWAWLIVLSFVCNAVLPAYAGTVADGSTDKALFCTSSGYQWFDVKAEPPDSEPSSHCVFCLNIDDDFDATYFASVSALGLPSLQSHLSAQASAVFKTSLFTLARLRAPPQIL